MVRVFGIWVAIVLPIIFAVVWSLNAIEPPMAVVYIAVFGAIAAGVLIFGALEDRYRDGTGSSRQS